MQNDEALLYHGFVPCLWFVHTYAYDTFKYRQSYLTVSKVSTHAHLTSAAAAS